MEKKLYCEEKDVSYGQQFFLDLLQKKLLFAFSKKHNLSYDFVHRVVSGKAPPSNPLVFALRDVIHPILWFYTVAEDKPQLKHYEPDDLTQFDYKKSIAFQKIREINFISTWAKNRGFNSSSFQKLYNGQMSPSVAKMKLLRNTIYPADWFFAEKNPKTIEKICKLMLSKQEYELIEENRGKTDMSFNRFITENVLQNLSKNDTN